MSLAQQRLWLLAQIEPDSPMFTMTFALRLRGACRVRDLEGCLDAVVRRHESLRTTFETVRGEPVQVVAPSLHVPLPLTDLRALDEGEDAREGEGELLRHIGADIARPFDLERGPLVRAHLYRLGDQHHVLSILLHHIISDGWSTGIFLRDVMELYAAMSERRPASLPPLPIQYADYSIWQRAQLAGPAQDEQLAWWKQQLAGAPPLLALPTDRPRMKARANEGGVIAFRLPAALAQSLVALGQREGATLYMTLLAALQALLYRYSGQTDVVVGSPIAGRGRAEVEPLIGFFVNTLAMRGRLDGNPTFRALLARVRDVALGAFQRQAVPFERLVEELRPPRNLAHSPIFQVMLALQNVPRPTLSLPGLSIEPLDLDNGASGFDLTLFLRDGRDGVSGRCNFSKALFDAATIEHLLANYRALLEAAVRDPDARIDDLPVDTKRPRPEPVKPRDAVEAVLAEVFAQALERPVAGVHDGFFELGGHALKAEWLLARVREIFRLQLPAGALFEAPTVEALARALASREARPGEVEKIARVYQAMKNASPEMRRELLARKRAAVAANVATAQVATAQVATAQVATAHVATAHVATANVATANATE
nr:hypothetical protein Hi04_10k_c2877_00016 [uncultured bacterium]